MTVGALAACALLLIATPGASALEKGIQDVRLEGATSAAQRTAIAHELGTSLKARWVRVWVSWSKLEPTRGTYSPSALAQLDAVVDSLRAEGVKVLFTTTAMPTWAQNQYWWRHPPPSYAKGPRPFYPIKSGALADYGDLGQFLATHFAGRVRALESWNEPNMWYYIYPQRTARDANYAARTYLSMLRAFSKGVRRAGTDVKVVAGATAPVGRNDRYRTSPQRFARYLRSHGATRLFDVYSHHPYTPGGTTRHAPDGAPNNPSITVTLQNLGTLLRVFPTKPFYLTEYGYNTRASIYFGGFSVTPSTQARYLKRAYAYARRYKRVKVLIWFLLYDWRRPGATAKYGVSTGLRTAAGAKKPAWFAFRAVR